MNLLFRRLLGILISLSIAIPSSVYADSRRRIVLTEVESDNPELLADIKQKIEKAISQSDDFTLVSSGQTASPGDLQVPADKIYLEGERQYLNLEYDKTLRLADQAISQYQKNPGSQGGLAKAWMLKAQIHLDKHNVDDAAECIQKAILANLSLHELEDGFYPPQLSNLYKQTYESFHPNNVKLTIQSDADAPIYVNGFKRAVDGTFTLAVPANSIQIVAVGQPWHATQVAVKSKDKTIAMSADVKAIDNKSTSINVIDGALRLGESVGADLVVMLQLKKDHDIHKLNLRTVNISSQTATALAQLDIINPETDRDSAVLAASNTIMTVNDNAFTESGKKKTPKALLYSIIGVLVVGAGVGVALGMGGGGGGGSDSRINLGSPAPSVSK